MKVLPSSVNRNPEINNLRNISKNCVMPGTVKKEADYDRITIGAASSSALSEDQFIVSLRKTISAEIQAGAPEQKLHDLKQQVAMNEYEINPSDIVRRLMLDSGEV